MPGPPPTTPVARLYVPTVCVERSLLCARCSFALVSLSSSLTSASSLSALERQREETGHQYAELQKFNNVMAHFENQYHVRFRDVIWRTDYGKKR